MFEQNVNRLVLGTLHLKDISQVEAFAILDKFYIAGGRWIDTAYLYGYGLVESLLGAYIKSNKNEYNVVTKVGYFLNKENFKSFHKVRESILNSIDRLDFIPKYVLLHEADWAVWWKNFTDKGLLITQVNLIDATFEIFDQCIKLGNEYGFEVGISGNNASSLEFLISNIKPAVILVAKQFDLIWNSALKLMTDARKINVPIWYGAPFHQGWLYKLNQLKTALPKIKNNIDYLIKILAVENININQIAISYILKSTDQTSKVIFGIKSEDELNQVLNNYNFPINEILIEKINSIKISYPPMPGPIGI